MSKITAALEMEEEALKEMKRRSSARAPTSKPHEFVRKKPTASSMKNPSSTQAAAWKVDLMDFGEEFQPASAQQKQKQPDTSSNNTSKEILSLFEAPNPSVAQTGYNKMMQPSWPSSSYSQFNQPYTHRNHPNRQMQQSVYYNYLQTGGSMMQPAYSGISQQQTFAQPQAAGIHPPTNIMTATSKSSFGMQQQQHQPSLRTDPSKNVSQQHAEQPTPINNNTWSEAFDKWFQEDKPTSSCGGDLQFHTAHKTPQWLEWDPLLEQAAKASIATEEKVTDHASSAHLSSSIADPFDLCQDGGADKSESVAETSQGKSPVVDAKEADDKLVVSELEAFLSQLQRLRATFTCRDVMCNPGHVIAQMTTADHLESIGGVGEEDDDELVVRISVSAKEIPQPVTFECNANSTVDHIISQALCIAMEDISMVSTQDFSFQVEGRQEYLLGDSRLSLYRYVQECCKFEEDVRLRLLHKSTIDRSLARTAEDDSEAFVCINKFFSELGRYKSIKRQDLTKLNQDLHEESQGLLDEIKREPEGREVCVMLDRLVDRVKAVCETLAGVETCAISYCLDGIKSSCHGTVINKVLQTEKFVHQLRAVVAKISGMYSAACCIDLVDDLTDQQQQACPATRNDDKKMVDITTVTSSYSISVVSLHRLPKHYQHPGCKFRVVCSLWHANQSLSSDVTADEVGIDQMSHFNKRVVWNKRMTFEVETCHLPLESMLRVQVMVNHDADKWALMAWADVPIFHHNRLLKYEGELVGLWCASKFERNSERCVSCTSDVSSKQHPVLLINFKSTFNHQHPTVLRHPKPNLDRCDAEDDVSCHGKKADGGDGVDEVFANLQKFGGSTVSLSSNDKKLIWNYRNEFVRSSRLDGLSLPLFLHCCPSWSAKLQHRQQAYNLLTSVAPTPKPEEALVLLTPNFSDTMVRRMAVEWLNGASDSDIYTWLPQLVQALRWELWISSPLSSFLLRRALGNVRIAHRLFWLLRENGEDAMMRRRYQLVQAALMSCVGEKLKRELENEARFVQNVHHVAEAVKDAKDSLKGQTLADELNRFSSFGGESPESYRLPTDPSSLVKSVDVENSSYFTSNAFPVKICMKNADESNPDFNILYKIGDDLRQDALTMQLIRVIEHMWLSEGLNLKLVTYDCLPTGTNQGFIELVSESKTLREIQSSYGLTGAFKDRPIAEWLGKYNPNASSYEKAVDNFTLSCAGYCVVTYVLGICDRHNDNIMLKQSGHLFHIDFGRFLGHAQMFGNIKRDRAPFVLTSDMAYVINGGDRPSSRFQEFVDLCCEAFNIIRKKSFVLINLLSLMLDCGIPQLKRSKDLQYVYDALKPDAAVDEATTMFTRLIDASLSSSFTRLNFFIHHIAQLRFNEQPQSDEDRRTLTFSPKPHPYRAEEGRIVAVSVVNFYKTYAPDKIYMFKMRVVRDKPVGSEAYRQVESIVTRTFDEFEELHTKLSYSFPPAQLPSFPGSVVVGRSQIKQVAVRRQHKLDTYLKHIFNSPNTKLSQHDLVYTFFHPILRDEDNHKQSLPPSLSLEATSRLLDDDISCDGKIKISLQHKNASLYVMIMHCKNLMMCDGTYPDPYVKCYLLPDPNRSTKRKTKVARKTINPTYNQMLIYELPLDEIRKRRLLCGVWDYGKLKENQQLGRTEIDLSAVTEHSKITQWYPLVANAQPFNT